MFFDEKNYFHEVVISICQLVNFYNFAILNLSNYSKKMKASALFKEYVWLVNTISRSGRITLREINENIH